MKSLYHISTEYLGLQKFGGLADYLGGLCLELEGEFRQTIVLPNLGKVTYPPDVAHQRSEVIVEFSGVEFCFGVMTFSSQNEKIQFAVFDGANAALLGNKYSAYQLIDDFPYLIWGKAVAQWCETQGAPDVLCTHDWQAAGVYAYMSGGLSRGAFKVHVIHNFAYQGFVSEGLDLDGQTFFHEVPGEVSSLQSLGISAAERVLTVSAAHLSELIDPDSAVNHTGVLRRNRDKLIAITNGLSADHWSPATSRYLPCPYDSDKLEVRATYRARLVSELDVPATELLILFQSRLVADKGIELIIDELPQILALPIVLVIHAEFRTSRCEFSALLKRWREEHPHKIFLFDVYQEERAHLLLAGSDVLLMPSVYEPCGQLQLFAMKFGALPVVHATGGLDETVRDADLDGATGWKFKLDSAAPISATLTKALGVFNSDRDRWVRMQKNAMLEDHSWGQRRASYVELLNSSK